MAREKHDKKAGGLIESMDINYSVIWAIKQKPSMTFCPLYVLLRGMKKNSHKSAHHDVLQWGQLFFKVSLLFLELHDVKRVSLNFEANKDTW